MLETSVQFCSTRPAVPRNDFSTEYGNRARVLKTEIGPRAEGRFRDDWAKKPTFAFSLVRPVLRHYLPFVEAHKVSALRQCRLLGVLISVVCAVFPATKAMAHTSVVDHGTF